MTDDRCGRCVDEITDLLHKIDDPAHLTDVRDLLTKLTSSHCAKGGGGGGGGNGGGGGCSDDDDDCRFDWTDSDDDGGACADLAFAAAALPHDRPVSLRQFVEDARPYTCDGGRLMERAVEDELADFGATAAAVFEERTVKLGDALAKEQAALLLRYRGNAQRALTRAQILQDHVRELMPTFRYPEYAAGPAGHVARVAADRKRAVAGAAAAAAAVTATAATATATGGGAGAAAAAATAEEWGTATEAEDAAARKKSLCALAWLRSEAERAECENAALGRRYDAVVAAIGAAGRRKVADECRAADEKRDALARLDELRDRSAKQVACIDRYVERMSSS